MNRPIQNIPVAVLFFIVCACTNPLNAAPINAADLVAAAKSQIGVTIKYDPHYQKIAYPNGDVPMERGVCTDVLIRAYRQLGFDLQQLVHDDMQIAWNQYPKIWGLKNTDTNIDHRRVPNLVAFFKRHGETIAASNDVKSYQPGDIVVWRLSSGVPHIGIVAGDKNWRGVPQMIHNIGAGAKIEDVLFDAKITGHFRWRPMLPKPSSSN